MLSRKTAILFLVIAGRRKDVLEASQTNF